ncbi:unnamed protein product [Paramecium pentaurelia]|uniref:Uncharacterized protein n=1 Tax=Paramecium pentaurelia TaxID=43138 RepID=A0A8S1XSR8_9CILI|nr:unnamed protein product [Paramecium pentaurelia]
MQNNQGGQSLRIENGSDDRRLERLEIKPINSNISRFNSLLQVWKEHDIPEYHQKYYYNVIMKHQQQADELMRIEIDSITNNKSVVRTLHQLTIGRERCLKEISRAKQGNISDFLKTISKFIYDLRKLTLNLIEFHRKWINSLNSKYEYNYIWRIKDRNYLHQIKEDHKFIQNHHPKMRQYFQFNDEDIFYLSVVRQAEQDDQQKYDHLIKHKMDQKYKEKMIDLQEYFNKQINDYKPVNLGSQSYQNSDINNHAGSPGFQGKNNINLSNYASKVIYTAENLEFNLVSYPLKDLEAILEYWSNQNVQELNDSFKYPINHIKDLLMYWQEAAIVRINQNGLIICSIDQEFNGRRWILHQIYLQKEEQWQQKLKVVIQHFIKMLIQQGDTFTSLAICCSKDQSIKNVLNDQKFIFQKNITYNKFNVVIYEQKIQNTQQLMNRQYFTPLTLRMLRIYAKQTDSNLITNEELLIAQYCANIGKNTIIQFENNILALSPYLNKSKLYGQEYMLIQKPNDVKNKYQIEFNTHVQTPVYFQQFNVKLNFKYFSSEFYRNNTQPYLRLTAHPTMDKQEPSILQLSSSEISNSMIYLISTIDPFIKIFIQEVQSNQISKSNIQSFINQTFEKFDKQQECQNHVWLPQFKCSGKQLKLNDTKIDAYFQNDTYLSVMYPRNPSLHTNKFFNDTDKIIQPPFLFGIVQSDLEFINKPLFSILIDKENIIKTSEKTINNNTSYPTSLQLQPKETESVIKELIKNTDMEIKKSFCSDPSILIYKLKYSLECSLINLNIGHALIYVDENHILEKRWVIETIMINDIKNLSRLLTQLIEYIFTIDPSANEIQISQTHYQEKQDLIANKDIMDSIKKAKFRWRQVDNDAKTQIRKTIYYLKRSLTDYPNKTLNQVSIQFRSYYATQQSQERNQIQNHLEYIHSSNLYQFFEDCFQYHVNGQVPDSNSFLQKKLQSIQGKLLNSEFFTIHSIEELKTQIKFQINLPSFESKYQQFDLLSIITQLKIKKQRQVIYKDKKYLEIPNYDGLQQIFESENYQLNQKIFFIATQDPLYFIYFIELRNPNLIQQIQQDQLNIVSQVSQAFVTKYSSNFQLVWIEQFKKIIPIHQNQNYLYIDFALNSQFSIEQSMIMEDESNHNIEEIYKIKLPMFCGLLNTQVRTQFERPLIGMIID